MATTYRSSGWADIHKGNVKLIFGLLFKSLATFDPTSKDDVFGWVEARTVLTPTRTQPTIAMPSNPDLGHHDG